MPSREETEVLFGIGSVERMDYKAILNDHFPAPLELMGWYFKGGIDPGAGP